MPVVGNLVTLAEWADKAGRSAEAIRNHWAPRPDFPAPKQSQPRTGSGPRFEQYDEDELDEFLATWNALHQPRALTVDGDPNQLRTLGEIARLAGVAGATITQYRDLLDAHTTHEDRGKRRFYRTGDVLRVLNNRPGHGVAVDSAADRRRRGATVKGKSET